jgi:hypothetical protein
MTEPQILRRMTRWFGTATKCGQHPWNEEGRHTRTHGRHTPHGGTLLDDEAHSTKQTKGLKAGNNGIRKYRKRIYILNIYMNTQTKSIKSSGIDRTARSGKHRKQFKAGSRSKHHEVTETQFLRRMTRWFETVTRCRADARNIGERHTETWEAYPIQEHTPGRKRRAPRSEWEG